MKFKDKVSQMYSMLQSSGSSPTINTYGDDDWATPKLKGNELDLHGCSHTEVTDSVENILILQYNIGNWPLTVITGNSQKMKSIVIKHASRRGFNTRLPIDNNPGSLIVF